MFSRDEDLVSDVSDSAPNATVRSVETDPERSEGGTTGPGLGLEPPYDLASTGDHDQESRLGLAWRPTGPGVCADRSTTASVSSGASVCERSRKREPDTSGSISNNPLFEPLSLSRRAF